MRVRLRLFSLMMVAVATGCLVLASSGEVTRAQQTAVRLRWLRPPTTT